MPTFGAGVDEERDLNGRRVRHEAQDIGAAYGAAVVSTCPGRVFDTWFYPSASDPRKRNRPGASSTFSEEVHGYVRVLGPENHVVYYAHLLPVYVHPGQSVFTGDLLGRVYHAGRNGIPHLHYQIRRPSPGNPSVGGDAVDPLPRLRELWEAGGWRAPHGVLRANPFILDAASGQTRVVPTVNTTDDAVR
jgi:murein DD-endopeptidase MepM/ murein hydrolase activator NlpD